MVNKNIGKNIGKFLGKEVVAELVDVAGMAKQVVQEVAPIVDKALDRQHEHNQKMIAVPDVKELSLEEAKEYCLEIGLKPIFIELSAASQYAGKKPNRVIDTEPRPGMLQGAVMPGSLIKIKYLDEDGIKRSKELKKKAEEKAKQQAKQQKVAIDQFVKQLPKVPAIGLGGNVGKGKKK